VCLFWDEKNKIYIIRRAGASSPLVSSEGWRNSGGRKKRREREEERRENGEEGKREKRERKEEEDNERKLKNMREKR
jgi:hypothetical protein